MSGGVSGGGEDMWFVIGGNEHHGRRVNLPTKPHKRAIHTHFARCYLNRSFQGLPKDDDEHKAEMSRSFEDEDESVASDDVDVGA